MNESADELAADRAARKQALELSSFIVEAPAGSGKTELLSQRILRLLCVVDAPEEIVAITFTRKAQAEMLDRVLSALQNAVAFAGDTEHLALHRKTTIGLAQAALEASKRKDWNLLEQPQRLRVLTIDALCMKLAHDMPILSGFATVPKVTEFPFELYLLAALRTLNLVEDDDDYGETVRTALAYVDNDGNVLSNLLANLLAKRDQWLPHTLDSQLPELMMSAIGELLQLKLRACVRIGFTPALQKKLMPLARYAGSNVDDASPLRVLKDWEEVLTGQTQKIELELPFWRALCELLLTKEDQLRKTVNKRVGFPVKGWQKEAMLTLLAELGGLQQAPEFLVLLAKTRDLPDVSECGEDLQTVATFHTLLRLAAAQLLLVFGEQNQIDFIEVAQRALQALGPEREPTELALAMDYRINHLLIDEFQDTNASQITLLRRLIAGWSGDDGRTWFAVGDPMQSIYRFRKAEVGIFLQVAQHGIGGLRFPVLRKLSLKLNNRSGADLVDWFNNSFSTCFAVADESTGGAIRYRRSISVRPALVHPTQGGVVVHPVLLLPPATRDQREEALACAVVECIKAEQSKNRQVKISVLVRARKNLATIAQLLLQSQISFQAVDVHPLVDKQCVQDVLSLTFALSHRADRLHWLAVLRAPWCGLTLNDLYEFAGEDNQQTIWQAIQDQKRMEKLSPDGRARLQQLRTVFENAFLQQGRIRLARWVEGVWLCLGGAGCLQDLAQAQHIRDYFSLLDRIDDARPLNPKRLSLAVEQLFAAPNPSSDGGLQLMTIHKAKGLEFDVVLLPDLHKESRIDEKPLMHWEAFLDSAGEESNARLIAAPVQKRFGAPSRLYKMLDDMEKTRAENESARLLYVAATRARDALHLFAAPEIDESGVVKPAARSHLKLLWPTVHAVFEEEAKNILAQRDTAALGSAALDVAALQIPSVARGGATDFAKSTLTAKSLIRACTVATPKQFLSPAISAALAPLSSSIAKREQSPTATNKKRIVEIDFSQYVTNTFAQDVGILVHRYLEWIAGDGLDLWPVVRVGKLYPQMKKWLLQRSHDMETADAGAKRCRFALNATLTSRDGQFVLGKHLTGAAEMRLMSSSGVRIVDRTFIEDGVRWIIDYKTTVWEADEGALQADATLHYQQLSDYAALFANEGLAQRLAVFYPALGRTIELTK